MQRLPLTSKATVVHGVRLLGPGPTLCSRQPRKGSGATSGSLLPCACRCAHSHRDVHPRWTRALYHGAHIVTRVHAEQPLNAAWTQAMKDEPESRALILDAIPDFDFEFYKSLRE
eukprot:SAG22_NODE_2170_length_2894_cov_4.900894_3_plen_115_part_00